MSLAPNPRLLLLPGMDGTGFLFEPLLEALPNGWEATVVRYPPDEPLGYAELARRVRDAIPDGEFVLVAESFSGPVALFASTARPPGLRGVALCASFVRSPLPRATSRAAALVTPSTLALVPAFVKARCLLGDRQTPRLRALLDQSFAAVSPAVLASRVRSLLAVDAESALRTCPAPLLYLRAADDRVVRPRSSELIAKIRPDTRRVELPGPHLVLQTEPARALDAIRSFVDGTARP